MKEIRPAQVASASAVLNTTRQLGAVVGAAVVGAVLQNQLAVALHEQAIGYAAQLPAKFQAAFVNSFDNAAKGGLQLGRGQSGASLPAGIPADVTASIQKLAHEVFTQGFLVAYKPTVYFAVIVLLVASMSCLLIVGRRQQPTEAELQADGAEADGGILSRSPLPAADPLTS
jgi:hypothetical protein